MSFKAFVVVAVFASVNAGYLEPAFRYAAPAPAVSYQAAPLVSYTSPAITKTEFIPGSYSSSYRSDIITPRVKYTETPAVSVTVPQPAIAVAPIARIAHVAPLPALAPAPLAFAPAPIARVGYGLTSAHTFATPLARIAPATSIIPALPAVAPAPLAFEHASIARVGYAAPLAHGFVGHAGFAAPLARGYGW